MIAAVAADELKCGGKAAFHSARHDARLLAPQARLTAMTRLTGRREVRQTLVITAQPRMTGTLRSAWQRSDTLTIG